MSKNTYVRIQSSIEKDDYDFLTEEGYAMSNLIRKIVSDWVEYKRVSRGNPIKSVETKEEVDC